MMPSMVPDQSAAELAQELSRRLSAGTKKPVGKDTTEVKDAHKLDLSDPPPAVLLVEPCRNECARIRNELIAGKIEVFTSGDLISTAHALSLFQPNLILAQFRLPTLGGLELVRWLNEQQSTRSIPVILYSDVATADERIQALDLGAVDLLTKPLASAELMARMRAVLKNRRTLSLLERRAYEDSLTGLSNRGVFEEHLLREWDVCRRRSVPLSVVIVDLDHFKSINDTYGHAAGDVVLRHAARTLMNSVRSSDLVARYGGEEFVVVAPNCPMSAAVMVSKRFRTNLIGQTISAEGRDIKVTASVGISTTDWTQNNPAELFHEADSALYSAKHSGRDAIWAYDTARRISIEAGAAGE
jgi:diguanylate cyclase (GGDEF)-like protein